MNLSNLRAVAHFPLLLGRRAGDEGAFTQEIFLPNTGHSPVLPRKDRPQAHFDLLSVYPNPASDQVWIVYQLPDGTESAELRVTDTLGRLIELQKVDLKNSVLELPTKNVASAALFCGLYVDGALLSTAKVDLIH